VFILTLTAVCAVVQASDIPFTPIMPKAFVEIVVGDLRRRTESIKRTKNTCTRWDTKIVLYKSIHLLSVCVQLTQLDRPVLGGPLNITFSVLREGLLDDKCIGKFNIDVEELLERQRHQADDGESSSVVVFCYD
jgi:hypothetical protein